MGEALNNNTVTNNTVVANNDTVKANIAEPQKMPQQQDNNIVNSNNNDISKYQGEIDVLNAKLSEQKKQYEKMQKDMERMIEEQEKNKILSQIQTSYLKYDNKDNSMSSLDIMKQVIKENSNIDVENKGKGYIEGVFETICRQGKENFDKQPAKSDLPINDLANSKGEPKGYLNTALKRPAVS